MNKLTIQAPDSSNVKTLSPMYSITTLLFNFFVPLFRKDWKYFGIMIGSLLVYAVIVTLLIPDNFVDLQDMSTTCFGPFSIIVFG